MMRDMEENLVVNEIIPECKVSFFELHDGKMHYLLTQHSLFNRKHKPFLLCKCMRGAGVVDPDHKCELTSHAETLRLHERSGRRWDRRRSRPDGDTYTVKKHMDWIDVENDGISHFGLHPNLLPRDTLRFDIFHLRCAITRRLLSYLQRFVLGTTPALIDEFSDILLKFWSEYSVLLFNMNKTFQSFKGDELLSFIINTKTIVEWFKKFLSQQIP